MPRWLLVDGTESGTFYFDGVRDAPVQANPLGMYEAPHDLDGYWSPDDKFVVVPSSSGKSTLVDLETGQRSAYLSDVFEVKGAASSHAAFRGWSPDGKKMAVQISSRDSSWVSETDLVSVDPTTLTSSYVATLSNTDDWGSGNFTWVRRNGTYDLAVVDSTLQDNPNVYRKPR